MLVKIENGAVAQYPYTRNELIEAFPNTSFPLDLSGVDLTEFGAAYVHPTDPPALNEGETLVEHDPIRVRARDGEGQFVADDPDTNADEAWIWVQHWSVVDSALGDSSDSAIDVGA